MKDELYDRLSIKAEEKFGLRNEDRNVRFDELRIWTRNDPPSLIPFSLNPVQSIYQGDLFEHYGCDASKPWELKGARENILKARQMGFSTYWLGLYYQMFYNLEYSQTVIITHRKESSNFLWSRIQTFEQQLRKVQGKPLPKLKYSNRRELTREDTGSSLFIGTAGEDDLARSGTVTNVHLSETAFWAPGTDNIRTGILGTIPTWANYIEESTANGVGAHYARYSQQRGDPASRYRAVFYGWTATPEYASVPHGSDDNFASLPSGHKEYAEIHGLTLEQALWRRDKLQEFKDENKEHLFAQEFPLTPEEAFMASVTNTYYDAKYLMAQLEWAKQQPIAQIIKPQHLLPPGEPGQLHGWLEIYEQPEKGHDYVLGADVAKGVVKGADGIEDRDYLVFDITDRGTRRHVASYWAREGCTPEIFAGDISAIGLYFNTALAIVESNNHGRSTLNELANHHKYPNVYQRKVTKTRPDGFKVETMELGFDTTTVTKSIADNYLGDLLREAADGSERGISLRGVRAIGELLNYGHLVGGKAGALTGHDDHQRALALCAVVLTEEPVVRRKLQPRDPDAYTGGRIY